MFDPGKPDQYPNNCLGQDQARYEAEDAYLLLVKNLGRIQGRMRIQIACGTKDDTTCPRSASSMRR